MNDTEFEALLSAAYAEPSARTPSPQMVAEIMDRAGRRRSSRRVVLAMATLAGCTIVAAAIVATGMAGLVSRTLAHLGPEPAIIDPSICLGIGFFLMLLAAARNEVREF
jgi:anti-sigma factor RsiW